MRSFEEVDKIVQLFPEYHRRWCRVVEQPGKLCGCMVCMNGEITKDEFELWERKTKWDRVVFVRRAGRTLSAEEIEALKVPTRFPFLQVVGSGWTRALCRE